jgi:hypothetical protein
MAIDYKELLKKYMQLVIDVECLDTLKQIGGALTDVEFSDIEIKELQKILESFDR